MWKGRDKQKAESRELRKETRRDTYVTRCQARLSADRVLLVTTIFRVDEHVTTEQG